MAVFKAKVSGNPTPNVTWAREDSKQLTEGAKTFYDDINKHYVLKVRDQSTLFISGLRICSVVPDAHWNMIGSGLIKC